MEKIKILSSGMLSTIQDKGRIGYQKYGVSVSGAADIYSMQIANILVGNSRFEACIETTYLGPSIEFYSDTCIAVVGADIEITLNNNKIKINENVLVKKGDILELGLCKSGLRSYIAISGGFNIPKVLGSKSTDIKAKLGGYKGRKILSGDEIEINSYNILNYKHLKIPKNMLKDFKIKQTISVILGMEVNEFTDKGLATFLNSEYRIGNQSDRMGIRLKGNIIKHKKTADIISTGITLGAVQVPQNGQPIIMLSDRQTIGGYTKIANVISRDISVLAQMSPKNIICFKAIAIEEAHKILKDEEEKMNEFLEYANKDINYYKVVVNKKEFNVTVEEL